MHEMQNPVCKKPTFTFFQFQQCSVCGPAKSFFSHPSFSYLLFSNSTHKTKIGTANRWETSNSNLPGLIKLSSQSETGGSSQ
jgi:hypothetical protein